MNAREKALDDEAGAAAAAGRTLQSLKAALERHDCDGVIALLANDIVIHSPITTLIRFEGIGQARDLFRQFFAIAGEIRVHEMVGDGLPVAALFWRGRVGHHDLEEANRLRLNDAAQIREMTVFMRAIPGLLALAERLAASLAGRRSWWRYGVVRFMLGFVGRLYRSNESFVVGLAGAGVSNKPKRRARP